MHRGSASPRLPSALRAPPPSADEASLSTYDLQSKSAARSDEASKLASKLAGQSFLFITPGEDLTAVFGPDWADRCFVPSKRLLRPFDANIVVDKSLNLRRLNVDYAVDPPLSAIGVGTSKLVGEWLCEMASRHNYAVNHWFSSPELRCLQTVSAIYMAMGNTADCSPGLLVVDPLCDWYGERANIPSFVNTEQMTVSSSKKVDDRIMKESNLRINWRYRRQANKDKLWDIKQYQGNETEPFATFCARLKSGFNGVLKSVTRYRDNQQTGQSSKSSLLRRRGSERRGPLGSPISIVCMPPGSHIQLAAIALRGGHFMPQPEWTYFKSQLIFHATCQVKGDGTYMWKLVEPLVTPASYPARLPFSLSEFRRLREEI